MTIKLEAGKYYKRRDGEKAYCVGVNPLDEKYPYVCACRGSGTETYTGGGRYYIGADHPRDIIAEWVDEPETGLSKPAVTTGYPSTTTICSGKAPACGDLKTHKFDTSTYVQIPESEPKLNISEWWVGVIISDRVGLSCDYIHATEYVKLKSSLKEHRYDYILQVKDWISVQMGLKDIEEFKV